MKQYGQCDITVDGEEVHNGPLLLTTVGNGGFCGGGFESCPRADLSDGLLEVLIVNNVSRTRFVALVPKYKSGRILEIDPEGGNLYKYYQAEKIIFEPNRGTMQFLADGEIYKTGRLEIEVVKDAINVVYL